MGLVFALFLVRRFEWDEALGIDLEDNLPVRFASGVLLRSIVNETELPATPTIPGNGEPTLIYVLGGAKESLKARLPLAASIYHRVSGSRVVFMDVREITEYSPVLGRNYTHGEWVIHVLMGEKVPAADIEGTAIPPGYFGTFGEARRIADLAKSRHAGRLILVTSMYHTRRVSIAFSHFLNGQEKFDVYGSDERIRFRELVVEYIKVLFYRYLLIPISAGLH